MTPFQVDDIRWDDRLIRKYDIQGPRYTSYPTAVQFHDIDREDVEHHYSGLAGCREPLSLYIHIPFCRHLCYYCACTKVLAKNRDRADDYLTRLGTEMALLARHFGSRPVTQLHFGGGTPTFLTTNQMTRLLDWLEIYFQWDPNDPRGEYSIELDPRETSADMLALLRHRGFNRVSFGIQDFNEATQIAVHRVQPRDLVEPLVRQARNLGFDSVNFDLIYGLPYQTLTTLEATLDTVLELGPDRISFYNYAHLPERFPSQKRIAAHALPGPEDKLDLMRYGIERLQQAGFRYIGMDHFARADDTLSQALANGTLQRNFQGYSTQAETDMLALGMSGISQIGGAFLQNHADLDLYEQHLDNGQLAVRRGFWLSGDDTLRRDAIGRLACQGRLDLDDLGRRHGIDGPSYFSGEWEHMQAFEADGLVTLDGHTINVTATGRLLLRPILMAFDAYLGDVPTSRFSKVL